jgi:hypothetical protein
LPTTTNLSPHAIATARARRAQWAALAYKPSEWSLEFVHASQTRYTAVCTTRQCGKTTSGAAEIQDAMMEPHHPIFKWPWVGVLSYDYEHAEMLVDRWIDWARDAFGQDYVKVDRNKHTAHVMIDGKPTARLSWHTASDPRSLGGPTYSTLFVDESQKVSDEAWNVIRPALNVRKARVFAFGTPDMIPEQTWYRGLWLRGQDGDPNYTSHTVTCFDNPWITEEEIADARETMSDEEFRMLMLGQWLDIDGRVFKDTDGAFKPDIWEAFDEVKFDAGEIGPFIMGVDPAKEHDYTVAYIFDQRRNRTVHKYRVNELNYPKVERELAALSKLWHVEQVVLDTTGAGNVVADHLIELGVPVRGVVFNNQNKAHMIADLTRRFQHAIIEVDLRDTQLGRELEVFRRKVSSTGTITYSSPVNYFDDSIIALALAAGYARTDIGVVRKNVDRYVNLGRGEYAHGEGSYAEHQRIIQSAKEAFAKER